jgi:hypothetical protein
MAGHGEKLGRKQEDAIAALLSQRTVEEAAHVTGVGVRTLLRWMKIPEFDADYRRVRLWRNPAPGCSRPRVPQRLRC